MAAHDVLGTVCDRLVGGVMFHLEHSDLCEWLNVPWLADLHKEGYEHDSACLQKMRRLSVDQLGTFVTEGRQDRSHLLDAYRQTMRWDVTQDVRKATLRDAMQEWIDWESGTVTVLTGACKRLSDGGYLLLSDKVRKIVRDTSDELAEARRLMTEMQSVDWDMTYVLTMHQ